ncbi:hypothetical protein Cni_G27575 [Canna indica]|uniref:BZIP domain-containing protein n=1 Tax=Canna indica TaxID=4628 RepID=A0AAQ3QRH9_9LILI|nr:hypothetical protein Cni_G27575 [Canna indica]
MRFGLHFPREGLDCVIMPNLQEPPNFGDLQCSGRHSCPSPIGLIPTATTFCADYSSPSFLGPRGEPNDREGFSLHQYAPPASLLVEEEPSWLRDLLNEPETPLSRGAHRRSSSDSFAYLGRSSASRNVDNLVQDDKHQTVTGMAWGSQQLDFSKDIQQASYNIDVGSLGRIQSTGLEFSMKTYSSSSLSSAKDNFVLPGSSSAMKKPDVSPSNVKDSQMQEEYRRDVAGSSDKIEGSQAKHSQSEMETNRAKRQFAQRSRVRKLQYISELERNVQALQAEGLEFKAQLQFLDQQNLLLSLENKTLKQRLDCLVHDHLLKCYQHEMLGQEISRLRALYHHHQQQQQQSPCPAHRRTRSTDIESQLAKLSLNGNAPLYN